MSRVNGFVYHNSPEGNEERDKRSGLWEVIEKIKTFSYNKKDLA